MYAISKAESYQVIGFNKNNTQQRLFSARTLESLLMGWAKEIARHEAAGKSNILPTFKKITVWNVEQGFTGLDLPYIVTVEA
jgi:hypothetical protein